MKLNTKVLMVHQKKIILQQDNTRTKQNRIFGLGHSNYHNNNSCVVHLQSKQYTVMYNRTRLQQSSVLNNSGHSSNLFIFWKESCFLWLTRDWLIYGFEQPLKNFKSGSVGQGKMCLCKRNYSKNILNYLQEIFQKNSKILRLGISQRDNCMPILISSWHAWIYLVQFMQAIIMLTMQKIVSVLKSLTTGTLLSNTTQERSKVKILNYLHDLQHDWHWLLLVADSQCETDDCSPPLLLLSSPCMMCL